MAIDSKHIPAHVKFFCAATAGVAGTLVCYPLDLLKLNMQVAGAGGAKREHTTTLQFANSIIRRDGFTGLYTGLTASMLRQALYTGVRLGVFQVVVDYYTVNDVPPGLFIKSIAGVIAGAMGGIAGLPPDVALTRMAVDKRFPKEQRRGYTHVFNALGRIYKEEGPKTLFRGITPVIVRAMAVNVTQLVSYVQTKEFLIDRKITEDNAFCHFICSVVASFVATTFALPPDMAKTRMQNMKIVNGVPEYKSMLDVWKQVVTKEGPFALWKGYTPLLLRNGPQFVVLFMVYERMMNYYRNMFNK